MTKVEPVVINSVDQVNEVEDQMIQKVTQGTVEVLAGKLEKLGFTKKQLVKTINSSREVLVSLARGEISEDLATEKITAKVITDLVGHERLLTEEEVNAIMRAIKDDMDVQAFMENLGMTKKELKTTIQTFVEKSFADMGIIPEKLINGLYKVIRDNWGVENMNTLIKQELLLQGTESFTALQDSKISKFFIASEGVSLDKILSFKEEAVIANEKFVQDKELESIKATLRRTNPDLADRLTFKDSVDITSGVDGVKVIDINRKKHEEAGAKAVTGIADKLRNFNSTAFTTALTGKIEGVKSVNL